jgi:hypothetical protein
MLGKNADHFMRMQAKERVSAMSPNGGGRSFSPPDQERAGAPQVTLRGGMGIPGPQRTISGGSIPGMGFVRAPRRPPVPGMLRGYSSALPGMGHSLYGIQPGGALPGMGGVFGVQPGGALPGMGMGMGAYVHSPAYQGVGAYSSALPGMGAIFGLSGETLGLMAGGAVLAFIGYKFMAKRGKK